MNLQLTNLDKPFWPEGITKGDLLAYYQAMASALLPLLCQRPLVLKRYPDGIEGEYFYQKQAPPHTPTDFPRVHWHGIDYLYVKTVEHLLWIINTGAIEIHAWPSRVPRLDQPDILLFDLDPAPGVPFSQVCQAALLVKAALEKLGLVGFVKTSGSRGLHIFVPIQPGPASGQLRRALALLCQTLVQFWPTGLTTEFSKSKRQGKVYLDYLQNTTGKSTAWVYSVRPLPGAPLSWPVSWDEVEAGNLNPQQFTLHNYLQYIPQARQLWRDFFQQARSAAGLLALLS